MKKCLSSPNLSVCYSALMTKRDVSAILEQIGLLLELKGENPFKARAYYQAARTIETLQEDLGELVSSGHLAAIKGIGKDLSQRITELVQSGRSSYYEELRASIPPGLVDMLQVQGLGPKKVRAIWEKLGITRLEELAAACRQNRLAALEGFGDKSQEKILKGIEQLHRHAQRRLFPEARAEAERVHARLAGYPKIVRSAVAGSLRRRRETIGDVDIVASAAPDDREAIMEFFIGDPWGEEVLAHGPTKSSIRLQSGLQVDLRLVDQAEYAAALVYFTGSKEHDIVLRALAQKQGLKLNEYGLFRGEERLPCREEEDVYHHLGLPWLPPELREGLGEVEAAQEGALPHLLELVDLQGTFHVHTVASDGADTLEDMVARASKLGWRYVGISDHSKAAFYAHGLSEEQVLEQHRTIDALNWRGNGVYIFKGAEVDILADGSLDYGDEFLEHFDFVVASVHSRFQLSQEEMTERICRALQNPHTTILGHPTGRLLLARDPYAVDLDRVLQTAAACGVAIEMNAHPKRLDLDWRYCRRAKELGVRFAINPDAHSCDDLEVLPIGVGIARKGGLERSDVLNTLSLEEMKAYLDRRKGGRRK